MPLFAGPAHVGQSFTYRITSVVSQAAPNVSTLVLTWTAPTHLYARLSGNGATATVSITRADDGTLAVGSSNSSDAAEVATLLGQLNFPGAVAAKLNGSEHVQMTMNVTPPTPVPSGSPAPAAQKSPAPVAVPLNVDLITTDTSATLIANGSGSNREGSFDRPMRGGGGWRSRDSDESRNEPPQPANIALDAVFDQSGSLEHATFRETFPSKTKGAQPIERTLTIERIDK